MCQRLWRNPHPETHLLKLPSLAERWIRRVLAETGSVAQMKQKMSGPHGS